MRMKPMPPDIASQLGGYIDQFFYKGSGEWAGPCPFCKAGHDRFVVFEAHKSKHNKPHGWCRQCDNQLWPQQGNKNGSGPSPQAIADAQKAAAEYERKQQERYEKRLRWLQESDFWLKWHDEMTPAQKQVWLDRGVGEWALETHKLGYRHKRNEALTIPYLRGDDTIVSLQYRLICPDLNGKYRFLKGMKMRWFLPWPHDDLPESKVVLVAEGAIKSMILFQAAGHMSYQGEKITIAATPAKLVPEHLFAELEKAQRIIWLLDPDAYVPDGNGESAIQRNVELAGWGKSLIVKPHGKVDDLINDGTYTTTKLAGMIRGAEPLL